VSTESRPPRDWVSFEEKDGSVWLFDASFLCSNWTCIFGNGCKGVLVDDATELQQGCCSYGAHFADASDRTRVRAAAKRLTKEQWQLKSAAAKAGGPIHRNEEGDWVTRLHDEACIFLNRPDFEGGPGCALHRAALDAGDHFLDWKPEVCWQLPLRLTHSTDENGRSTHTLREWQRRDWGEGGLEFHWWCTESHDAFVGHQPVYEAMRGEIIALVGKRRYQWFVDHVRSRPQAQILPHPHVKRRKAS
jgi:hypothetical protein